MLTICTNEPCASPGEPGRNVGSRLQRSDKGAIADVLLLHYWIWGAAFSAAIIALLWWSFRLAFRR